MAYHSYFIHSVYLPVHQASRSASMKYFFLLASAAALFASLSAATTPITNRTNTGVEFVSGNYVEFQPGFLGMFSRLTSTYIAYDITAY